MTTTLKENERAKRGKKIKKDLRRERIQAAPKHFDSKRRACQEYKPDRGPYTLVSVRVRQSLGKCVRNDVFKHSVAKIKNKTLAKMLA